MAAACFMECLRPPDGAGRKVYAGSQLLKFNCAPPVLVNDEGKIRANLPSFISFTVSEALAPGCILSGTCQPVGHVHDPKVR